MRDCTLPLGDRPETAGGGIRPATPHTLAWILALGLLVAAPPVRATTLTGPFVGCQQATEPVATNGSTFFLPNGNQHPVPPELQPTSAFTIRRVPASSLLVSQRAGGTTCFGSHGEGHVLFIHDIPAASGAPLAALRTNVCIPEQVAQAGHCVYDRRFGFSPQRVVAVRERTGSTAIDQRTLWIDLDGTAPDSFSSHTSPIFLTSFSPAGDAAVIQHDLDDPVGEPDWSVIDLCPGSAGSVLATVVDLESPVTPEVVQLPDGTFVVRLTHADGAALVTLPDCLGPPPPPPPTDGRLTVTAAGPGNGVVQDPQAQIQCATDGNPNLCQADFSLGTTVTLFAIGRDPGAVFQGWSGDCTGTQLNTTVLVDADRACTATFDEVRAELAVAVAATPEPALAGGPLTVTATITNSGPDPALAVTLTVTPPPTGATVDLAQLPASCVQQTSGDVVCNLGTLAPGGSAAPAIVLDVDPFTRGSLSTVAAAATTTWESNLADNAATAVSTVAARADLALVKSAAPEPVARGTVLVYRLAVTNTGPSASLGATVVDTLPGFVTLRSNPGNPTPTFALGGLAPGRTAVGTVLVDVDPAAPIGQGLTNAAGVLGADPDPSSANDVASVTSTVSGPLTGGLGVPGGPLGVFLLVADTSTPAPEGGGGFDGFDLPALDGDTVGFGALTGGGSVRGVYRRVGGRIVEVARQGITTTPDGRTAFSDFELDTLSVSGDDVGLVGIRPAGTQPGTDVGFYRTGPCFLEPLADRFTAQPLPFVFGGRLRGDEAVLLASGEDGFHGIVRTDGQSPTVLYERTIPPNGDVESLGEPAWDGTTVAFRRVLAAAGGGPPLEAGILVHRDGVISTAVDLTTPVPGGTGTFSGFGQELSVDGDLVAFEGFDADGDPGIYAADLSTGVVHLVADTGTPIPGATGTFELFPTQSAPSVSAGRVAFVGRNSAGEGGLFLWQDGALQTVITDLHPLPPSGVAFPLIGTDALSGDRLAFGNGLSVWIAELDGGGTIFADGFESGDTTAWTASVP